MTSREAYQRRPSYLRVEQDDPLRCTICGNTFGACDIWLIFTDTSHYPACKQCTRVWVTSATDCGVLTYEQEHQTPESPATEAIETRRNTSGAVRGERQLSSPPESSGTEASQATRQWEMIGGHWHQAITGRITRTPAQRTADAVAALEQYNALLASDIPL